MKLWTSFGHNTYRMFLFTDIRAMRGEYMKVWVKSPVYLAQACFGNEFHLIYPPGQESRVTKSVQ